MILADEKIKSDTFGYDIELHEDFNGLAKIVRKIPNVSQVVVVTDKNVAKLYLKNILDELRELAIPVNSIVIKGSEKNKSIDKVKKVYNKLAEFGCDRKSLVLAFGGGVVGDFAGFIASTFLRGIRFGQIPTTLLACVDSSVGGKVAVNIDWGKNMVGQFYQPVFVYAPIHTLSTLPKKEWKCGTAEVIKHALLSSNQELFNAFDSTKNFKLLYKSNELITFIIESVRFKSAIVQEDFKESGKRAILNLGHTIGHAIESFTNYKKYSHGEAVSIGLLTELLLSHKLKNFPKIHIEEVLGILKKFGMPYKENIPVKNLLKHMKFDKKNEKGSAKFVLLKSIGEPVWGEVVEDIILKEMWNFQRSLE